MGGFKAPCPNTWMTDTGPLSTVSAHRWEQLAQCVWSPLLPTQALYCLLNSPREPTPPSNSRAGPCAHPGEEGIVFCGSHVL
jgi:hypothetical protein